LKKIISNEELHNLIIELVRRNPDFTEVSPNQPYFHERDIEGCNWNLVRWIGLTALAKEAKNFIAEEVVLLRLKYDLASQ
jgi:hypothetical protein